MPRVFVRARARRDILSIAEYLEEQGGPALGLRFVHASQETFDMLAATPKAGLACEFSRPTLRRVRRWPLKDFENWLIFYLPRRDGVEILHVIHVARDIESLFNSHRLGKPDRRASVSDTLTPYLAWIFIVT